MSSEEKKTAPPRRRWFQFRLRTLLVLALLASGVFRWIGWELDQRRREKKTIEWAEGLSGSVYFSGDDFNGYGDINGVRDRVDIQAECLYGDLRDQRALIICDIEGAKQSLLVNSGVAEDLAIADLVVEAHDFLCDGISDRLMQKFSDSHHVQMIESVADEERPRRFGVDEISDLTTEQQILALAERRPTVMRWIVCQSKEPFKQKMAAGPKDQVIQPRQPERLG